MFFGNFEQLTNLKHSLNTPKLLKQSEHNERYFILEGIRNVVFKFPLLFRFYEKCTNAKILYRIHEILTEIAIALTKDRQINKYVDLTINTFH